MQTFIPSFEKWRYGGNATITKQSPHEAPIEGQMRTEQTLHMKPPTHRQYITRKIKGKRKVQGVPQSQTLALPRHQEEEETDKSKQAQIEQAYKKL